jgi:quinoprotein glucose dehydrogenase
LIKNRRKSAVLVLTVTLLSYFAYSTYLGDRVVSPSPAANAHYEANTADWPVFGGKSGGGNFSSLENINRNNVSTLSKAWEYQIPEHPDTAVRDQMTQFQAQAIAVNNLLYFCTPAARVIALDPASGQERWRFDTPITVQLQADIPIKCRGVSYWESKSRSSTAAQTTCQQRIFVAGIGAHLYALDANTGERCRDFGADGTVDLNRNIGGYHDRGYGPTSAPVVAGNIVIVGARIMDNIRVDAPSGAVRAFDVITGKQMWGWNPVAPGTPAFTVDENGNKVYKAGTVNSWAPMTVDPARKLLFVPTGSPSPDLYGGHRNGDDHYGSSTVALDLDSGQVRWNFQTVHHDVWDYDVGSPPMLLQHPEIGKGAPAVVQATKMGHLFLLNRETGEPLYPVEERPVPQHSVPGEKLSPTQPFPTHPESIHSTEIGKVGLTPIDRYLCEQELKKYRWDGIFTPPSLEGSITFPGPSGGMNWSSAALDPASGILVTTQTHLLWMTQLLPRAAADKKTLSGNERGKQFVLQEGTPYAAFRFPILSPLGTPCSPTPWGSLTAVDLKSGKVLWRRSLGTTRDLAPFPIWAESGTPNFGGAMITAGGLAFATGTTDHFLRAYDLHSGDLLMKIRTDGLVSTVPSTYRLDGSQRQYLVVGMAGSSIKNGSFGEAVYRMVAYALPETGAQSR